MLTLSETLGTRLSCQQQGCISFHASAINVTQLLLALPFSLSSYHCLGLNTPF